MERASKLLYYIYDTVYTECQSYLIIIIKKYVYIILVIII